MSSFPLIHQNFFRYSWSSCSWLTHLLPTPLFREFRCNCGKALPLRQPSSKGKPRWSGLPIGRIVRHRSIYFFLTSSDNRYLLPMVTTIVCIWIQWVGGSRLLSRLLYFCKIRVLPEVIESSRRISPMQRSVHLSDVKQVIISVDALLPDYNFFWKELQFPYWLAKTMAGSRIDKSTRTYCIQLQSSEGSSRFQEPY